MTKNIANRSIWNISPSLCNFPPFLLSYTIRSQATTFAEIFHLITGIIPYVKLQRRQQC